MIETDLIAPISQLLKRQAHRFPAKIAYSDAHMSVTYEELQRVTENLASRLKANGLAEGAAVALWLPNSVNWVIACLAIVRAGAICVPISFDATEAEVSYRIEDASCSAVITQIENADLLNQLVNEGDNAKTRIFVGTNMSANEHSFEALCRFPAGDIELEEDDIDRPSYIVYTSGTTGKAKGVVLTTRSMLWVTAACWVPALGLNENDYILSPLPLFHSYALNFSVLSILAVGAREYILERFSTQSAAQLLASEEFSVMPGVPTMFHYLLQSAQETGAKPFANMRCCVSAGAIMPASLNNEFESYFGVPLLDGYGITETSTMVTMNWLGKKRFSGSCGLPLLGLALRIVDPVQGKDVPLGQEGELICRGPNLMIGYHNKPKETAAALREGWYHTGDLARSDTAGFITITGRLKELIIRGGQNIAPAEVEETIHLLECVKDCAIVGISHETLGEVPVAFIVSPQETQDTKQAILDQCSASLSSYKIPNQIHFVSEIPRTGSGKIMRFKLQEIIENK